MGELVQLVSNSSIHLPFLLNLMMFFWLPGSQAVCPSQQSPGGRFSYPHLKSGLDFSYSQTGSGSHIRLELHIRLSSRFLFWVTLGTTMKHMLRTALSLLCWLLMIYIASWLYDFGAPGVGCIKWVGLIFLPVFPVFSKEADATEVFSHLVHLSREVDYLMQRQNMY